ncbi:diaminobutyrate--2-oxoglutarate transaminase [Plantactinospora sp. BC1]|uniref:diaminobutyrate--2-oxoglutarate transaminase n=1 Tax=Plantactinospora sp. BC1 TaxID=2108470 RepID=UPI001F363D0A|nr:diaminobutyrate--2-oxoglutarate transaminase [Plantactinospora sp. BC1]
MQIDSPRADEQIVETTVFEELESNVRTYCRRFPAIFTRARGDRMWDQHGREYLDFMAGAGALNYGHNHPTMKRALLGYLAEDRPVHTLDLHTPAKAAFLSAFRNVILAPRHLDYRVQFTGPTGANSVEAAFKVARRATGRSNIVAFTNGFHGGSLGALAASGNLSKRSAGGVSLGDVVHLPYEGYLAGSMDTIAYLEAVLDDPAGGVETPAAVVVETVQGEGGLAAAGGEWLRRLEQVVRDRGILLIVDDIQAGCGRTGRFFSFEEAGIRPDLVCLAKSISGFGLPMALTLIRPELDVLEPGAHAGTFRGNNLAFVTATAALSLWADPAFEKEIQSLCAEFDTRLTELAGRHPALGAEVRGRGLMRGLFFARPGVAAEVSRRAFERGVLTETSGARGQVLKLMPPVTTEPTTLHTGLDRIADSVRECAADQS